MMLFATGCNSVPVQTVKVAVPVRCQIQPIEPPVLYFEQAKEEDNIFDKIKLLLAERIERHAYEKNLEAALLECSK